MSLLIESKKLKRTGYLPAFLAGGFLATAFPVVYMMVKAEEMTALAGNPINILMSANWQMMAMLNILISICGACMMYHTEYADNGMQKMSVLRARVNTQLRKAAAMSEKEKDNEHVYRKEPYVFDFDRMKFMVDGKEIELSKTEQKLLRILVENAGMNMRRELLLDRVWSDGAEYVDENALSVSIKRLRDKLGAEHAIRTVYGIGYRWE